MSIEPQRAHIREVVIISVEVPAVEKRLSLPCVNEIVGCVHAWSLRQHSSRECNRNGSKHVPHLREDWSSAKISEEVLTGVRGRVEGKWESESEAEQPYIAGRGYLGYSWVHVRPKLLSGLRTRVTSSAAELVPIVGADSRVFERTNTVHFYLTQQ